MPTSHPTAKQQQVLDFIKSYYKHHNYSPTFREIGAGFDLSAGTVRNYLNALEARELITRNANESRSIQLVESK